jgi:uncharacterized membrane protein
MNKLVEKFSHYADVIAIFLWIFLIHYFYSIKKKTNKEKFALFLVVSGFVLDTLFTFFYIRSPKN